MDFIGMSDIGLMRKKNEDSYLINEDIGLFIVCDGMGGHKSGDIASDLAVKEINNYVIENNVLDEPSKILLESIQKANYLIWHESKTNPECYEMGTTVTAAIIHNNKLIAANVGDSCLYIIRNNNLIKVTKDHTLAEQMLSKGLLSADEINSNAYNHVLTRALGIDKQVVVDLFFEEIYSNDFIILCSDGLTDLIPDAEILEFIMDNYNNSLETIAKELIELAIYRGGSDNITIILIRI
ncbi:Protein serine/threonine phosphatase PrpC, regulation of stationary phase [Candidatus Syntrophocurvum alkaliphilum]|uniref:Protein serine/threonine phosphatase PrpC, regulation of stationary phase n=1 Tax=Candidatus Syntrophocurvum alkaliphilum TaxID=2293317 RepID=A0A6I6DF48_9FIRM|nr:Stp1/IreP family PP2C-type Ser/Thr phosphatase [Candidatus Syntrophocurvum alkaliphilum]QGT99612.1 Protein serine/threonine phosphatase PrpC, regulation of stationary phase [Candidatus Syntrophocurvum alkaliphilum]